MLQLHVGMHLILFLVRFLVDGVESDLFVVLLEGGHIFSGLGELAFFHSFSDVPVDKGALGVHEIELVVKSCPRLGDGGRVGEHADGAVDGRLVGAGNGGRLLVVDADLETGWAPVDELDAALGLDLRDRGVDVLGDDVTSVEQAAGHVLAVSRVALDHLVLRLEASIGYLSDRQLLVSSAVGGDDRRVGCQREVDSRVRHQVSLELVEIDVESAVESERGGDRGDNLADHSVQVRVARALDAEVVAADVVDGLVVDHEGAVGVLESGMGCQDRVVGLDNGGGDLRSGVDSELELGLFAVVDGETLHEEGGEAGTGTATERVEDEEALETGAVVGELTDSVEHIVDDLLADGVVATSVVVGRIFFAGDQLLGMVELSVLGFSD